MLEMNETSELFDEDDYESFQYKCELITSIVRDLESGNYTTAYFCGPAGTRKMESVIAGFDHSAFNPIHCNALIDADELAEKLRRNPNKTFVLHHCEFLEQNRPLLSILLNAVRLHCGIPYPVDFGVEMKRRIRFNGRIVCISDLPLLNDNIGQLFQRWGMPVIDHSPTAEEIAACMRSDALKLQEQHDDGGQYCRVVETVINEVREIGYPLNFNMLDLAERESWTSEDRDNANEWVWRYKQLLVMM